MMPRALITESDARFDGVRTRTLSVAGEGPPILLLHGFTDSADSWRPLLAELAAAGRCAVAVDLPGSGKAELPSPGPVLEGLDRFTHEFVRTHSEEGPVALAGNSLGGLLALRAAHRPELPLLAVAGISPGGLVHRRLEVLERVVRRFKPALWALCQVPVPARVVALYAELMYRRRLLHGSTDASLARYYASHYHGMRDIQRFGTEFLALAEANRADPLALEQVCFPVLLIWGSRDPLADVDGAQLVLDAVPASRLVVFDDCGHCAQVERPADVADLLAGLPASAEREAVESDHISSHATTRGLT